jgi:N-dimethylarginine dimethylaminohydrolase
MIDLYLMSPPSPGWALQGRANFRSREAPPVSAARARQEWLALAEAIEARGGTVVALPPPSDALTGMPYAAECGHVVSRQGEAPLFLLPRMASPHRKPEREHWAALATAMGFVVVDPGRGTWEAQGDIASFEGVTLLFHGGRTDREGMEAAAEHMPGELLRLEIREPAFHGNMALLPLPSVGRLVVCPEVICGDGVDRLAARFGEERLLFVSEAEICSYATNGLPVGDALLAPSILPPRVDALFTGLGLRVERLAMAELCEKAGGASRCLVSYARLPQERACIPAENRLAAIAAEIRAERP